MIEKNSLWIRKIGCKHEVCEVVDVDERDIFYLHHGVGRIFYYATDFFERDFLPIVDENLGVV